MERFEDALRWFRRGLEIRPGLTAAKINAGIALRQLKRFEEAAVTFSEVLATTPDDALACLNLGLSLRALQRNEEALDWLRKASDLRPADAESARELADVLTALKRNEEAIRAYEQAVALQPHSIAVLFSFGERLQEEREVRASGGGIQKRRRSGSQPLQWLAQSWGRLAWAQSICGFACGVPSGSCAGAGLRRGLLQHVDRTYGTRPNHEAIEASRKALFIEAGSPVASFNLGCALLALGNFREGWEGYDYRFVMGGNKWLRPEARAAPWTGEPLAGKSILILGEQGNGDQIQFSRYLPALSDLGASVYYLAPDRLHRLFRTLGESHHIAVRNST